MGDFLTIPTTLASDSALIPERAYEGDAGYDLCSTEDIELAPFQRVLISTGLSMEIPSGYAGFVLPRSGLAIRKGLSLVNTPGLIDSNYRGEIKAIAINLDPSETITVSKGDRIAQLVIMKIENARFTPVDSLEDSQRGCGGFGSSGVSKS